MKRLFSKLTILAFLAGIMAACGGSSSGGLAGIGGSGYISSGSVSGFGSVFVNGVEFDTDSAIFEIEDSAGNQQDLRIGMVVQVEGSINTDGVSGTATGIRYGDQLEGPVTIAPVANTDNSVILFQVMGTHVIADAVDTVYEGTSFANLRLNNMLEISGYYDQNAVLNATYIKLKAADFDPASNVEIEGYISNVSGTVFTLRNVTVNATSANISGMTDGLQNGIYVEVKGHYNSDTNTITASEVEAEKIELKDDGSEVSIEGFITRFVSNSDFDINGQKINAAAATLEPATLVLRAGLKVEAEGGISNGILTAKKVETSSGDAKVFAFVKAVNAAAGTLSLRFKIDGPEITVSVSTATTLEDDLYGLEPFKLVHLVEGEFVEVVGYETGTSSVAATKVKRLQGEKFLLQGNATAATTSTITVLGVTYDYDAGTEFEGKEDTGLDPGQVSALISAINSTTPVLVKIVDEDKDGIAEEIDQED